MSRMLGLVLLALVGLAVVTCASAAGPKVEQGKAAQPYAGGPRLAFQERSVDYGKVQFNQTVKATFDAKNVGDKPLTIRNVDVQTIEGC